MVEGMERICAHWQAVINIRIVTYEGEPLVRCKISQALLCTDFVTNCTLKMHRRGAVHPSSVGVGWIEVA